MLVIVPHEDDEINTAGVLIDTLSTGGAKITLAFTTNGDWKHTARERISEAVKAASVLGVLEENIVFLGYGDSINNENRDHLFYHQNEPARSVSGHQSTYGWDKYCDFAFRETGEHHAYTALNYLDDIVTLVEKIRPDMIVCTDFDEHPDHRMLALYLDRAIGIIRRKDSSYCPILWKSLAYAFSYTATADHTAFNNPETKRPQVGETGKYAFDLLSLSYYCWDSRIRIPAPPEIREPDFCKNLIAEALRQHKSQGIITRADGIINSDEIFFSRRTDSLGTMAQVLASSGAGSCLNDFLLYDTDDIDAVEPRFTGVWRPDDEDTEKSAVFCWDAPVSIRQAVLYGAISSDSGIQELELSLSDGYCTIIKNLPKNGRPLIVDFPEPHNVRSCKLRILSAFGEHYGLSECEFFETDRQKPTIPAFCKILIDDNFAYDYVVGEKVRSLPINTYCFGNPGSPELSVQQGKSTLKNGILYFDPDDTQIRLRAECSRGDIWDEISITRLTKEELACYFKIDDANRQYIEKEKKALKVRNMLFILRRQGPAAVLKRAMKNVIGPALRR